MSDLPDLLNSSLNDTGDGSQYESVSSGPSILRPTRNYSPSPQQSHSSSSYDSADENRLSDDELPDDDLLIDWNAAPLDETAEISDREHSEEMEDEHEGDGYRGEEEQRRYEEEEEEHRSGREEEEAHHDEDDDEDFDLDYHNPDNLKVEYLGKLRMAVVDQIVEDSFLETDEPGAVPRLVVIDAANILHGLTPLLAGDHTLPTDAQPRVDAAYILSLVRFFVSKGFECMVVAQHKYKLDNVTDNMFIMHTLMDLGLLMVMDHTYDDLVLFSVASEFDAVIVTEDQFRAEQHGYFNGVQSEQYAKEFMTPNVKNALQLRVSPIYPRTESAFLPKSEWGKVSSNGHFVVDHLMRFEGTTENLRQKFFSTADRGGHRFELVQEKYDTWVNRKDQVLSALDVLLAKMQPIMEKKRKEVSALLPRGN